VAEPNTPSRTRRVAFSENRPSLEEDWLGLGDLEHTLREAAERRKKPNAISVLSHELLSPLTLIKGYTATLLQLSKAINETQKNQYLKGIESASNRVIRLIENLRHISRIEQIDTVIVEPSALLDLLTQCIFEVQGQTTKHAVKLTTLTALSLVKIDPQKIEQVMSNLLSNAIKYTPRGGDIEVTIGLVKNAHQLKELYDQPPLLKMPSLIVSVIDSGLGLPETELEDIFEPFYRVNSRTVHTTAGAGLGLYICRTIVEAHAGQIWARNRSQGGSIFNFSLPVKR
jgi:signal transduction histidine kinase